MRLHFSDKLPQNVAPSPLDGSVLTSDVVPQQDPVTWNSPSKPAKAGATPSLQRADAQLKSQTMSFLILFLLNVVTPRFFFKH